MGPGGGGMVWYGMVWCGGMVLDGIDFFEGRI